MKLTAFFILFLSLFSAISCKREITYEKGDVIAVWKHDVARYSVTIQNKYEIADKGFHMVDFGKMHLVADVPENKSMWYEAYYKLDDWTGNGYTQVVIHIHSIDDLRGAEWQSGGKLKIHGQTERVE
jgi:hypothetical protein